MFSTKYNLLLFMFLKQLLSNFDSALNKPAI